MESKLAPIVVFVYNRPDFAFRTLSSLKSNHLADKSKLYIIADGPKLNADKEQLEKIKAVREIIRKEKWCGKVEIIERKENFGVDKSIVSGINQVLNLNGKIIVVEDDLQLSPYFLEFMNKALTKFENEEKIMHIGGYNYIGDYKPGTIALHPIMTMWGWATWKRAWDNFNPDSEYLWNELTKRNLLNKFTFEGYSDHAFLLYFHKRNIDRPWDIVWYANILLNNGLAVNSGHSISVNFGLDKSGVHNHRPEYIQKLSEIKPEIPNEIAIKEDKEYHLALINFFESIHKNPIKKFMYKNFTKSFLIRKFFEFYHYYHKK